MGNGTENPPKGIEWRRMRRVNTHRTSKLTDEALRRIVGEIAAARGSAPNVDTVIFAALRMVGTQPITELIDVVREIETDTYPAPLPHEPGS